jgi:flavin reductase (DIM6/NTAB) family NADH-FMN oxidoreductase RutF
MSEPFVFVPTEQPARACNKMLSSIVVPRPIAMISSISAEGVANIAPYSYYQPVTWSPMLVSVSIGMRGADRRADTTDVGFKDTYVNAVATGEFVVNVTTHRFQHHIEAAATEYPSDVDEFDVVPWSPIASQVVEPPSIAEAPVRLECRLHEVFDLGDAHGAVKLVIGEVVCIVADPTVVVDEMYVDAAALGAVGRLGGREYLVTKPEAMYSEPRVALR